MILAYTIWRSIKAAPLATYCFEKGNDMQSPREIRNAAIAYLVWCEATKAEWNITLADLTERVCEYFNDQSITINVVRGICQLRSMGGKTWLSLIRSMGASAEARGDTLDALDDAVA